MSEQRSEARDGRGGGLGFERNVDPDPGADDGAGLPIEAVLELFLELDEKGGEADLAYDRICEAACRLTSLERAILMLYDHERHVVLPVGSHGVEPELLTHTYGTLEETPIAQRALSEKAVVVTDDLARDLPRRYSAIPTVEQLVCVPVAAADRWYGVVFADAAGSAFELSGLERRTMLALGRIAALATHVRETTARAERGRRLSERIGFAREVHEHVMQRLFGVSLALGGEEELSGDVRRRTASEIEEALGELREALERSVEPEPGAARTTLAVELDRIARQPRGDDVAISVGWDEGIEIPVELEPLAVSVVAEAVRNAEKHADPRELRVDVRRTSSALVVEVTNDGTESEHGRRESGPGSRLGLRLASFEAAQRGCVLEFGPLRGGRWRVRLVLPGEPATSNGAPS